MIIRNNIDILNIGLFLISDPREKSKMIPFSTKGHCTMGHYKSSKGINDEQECLDKCLVETECRFVSFNKGSCERYRGKYCKLTVNKSPDSKLYKTFKKVPIGETLSFPSTLYR